MSEEGDAVTLDVRTPAGGLFLVLGALLAVYGAISDPAIYQRSLGINVNLVWGAVMIIFGAAMLAWRRWPSSAKATAGKVADTLISRP